VGLLLCAVAGSFGGFWVAARELSEWGNSFRSRTVLVLAKVYRLRVFRSVDSGEDQPRHGGTARTREVVRVVSDGRFEQRDATGQDRAKTDGCFGRV
jgi:hypothetical protein